MRCEAVVGFPAIVANALPTLVDGQPSYLVVDTAGRLLTKAAAVVSDGPSFTIPNGTQVSNDVDPRVDFDGINLTTWYDATGRLAGEVISLQVSYVAVPAAGDWRVLIANVFAATLNIAVSVTQNINAAKRLRLVSSVAVGGDRTFNTMKRT